MTTVIDFIYKQKGSQQELFRMLHSFISEYENISSSIKWSLPFWTIKKTICYANPKKSGGAELVFWNGTELQKDFSLLELKGRQRMAGITYRTSDDIDFELLDQLIQKAIFLDEHYKPTWKKK
jgi:hypothetical protein